MPDQQLRSASFDDLQNVLALLRSCQLLESGVAEAISDFLVARSADGLLGCVGLEIYGDLGLLRSVAVDLRARKCGLGRKLVEAMITVARHRRLRELYLLTTTAPTFFERLGFMPTTRASVPTAVAASWEFQSGCPQTALPMRLVLED
ncbi:MAG TPA: arsenic resistance N-acetyltransferase ArsN2 [Polyangiaceae bacterium]|nr:arsenic resistance N-acetyltransferase ArsN2 [Polyangiaceae bacterium]